MIQIVTNLIIICLFIYVVKTYREFIFMCERIIESNNSKKEKYNKLMAELEEIKNRY